ncbi:hypothetical protein BGZ72_008561 [Mortierella alpina]|nr:hypothetical protein BGZ72_008561 [Mortierella alpina]
MSGLTFNCLTTDPGATTFYGVIVADDHATGTVESGFSEAVVVVKSNTNPASPLSVTWTVISKIAYRSLTDLSALPNPVALCAINSKGVLSLLLQFDAHTSKPFIGPAGPRVYQYDPNGKTDGSFGYTGAGSWSNVTVDETNLIITERWITPQLQYLYNGQVETLILSFVSNSNVNFVALNEATNTFAHAATWRMNKLDSVVISGSRLYVISVVHPFLFASSFPISFPIPANIPQGRIIDTSGFGRMDDWSPKLQFNLVSSAGTLYVLAYRGSTSKEDPEDCILSQTENIEATTILSRPVKVGHDIISRQYFVPVGGEFALMKDYGQGQVDGITLTVPIFGDLYTNISIDIADSINPVFFEAVQTRGEIKTGVIVGITAIVLGLVGVGIGHFIWRKRSKARAAGAAGTFAAPPAVPPKDYAHNQGEPGTFMGYGRRPVGYEQTSNFVDTIDTSPTTAAPTVSGPQVQALPGHMQGLQLSSHPRPNVVYTGTTVD